jgi:hypothetical protein
MLPSPSLGPPLLSASPSPAFGPWGMPPAGLAPPDGLPPDEFPPPAGLAPPDELPPELPPELDDEPEVLLPPLDDPLEAGALPAAVCDFVVELEEFEPQAARPRAATTRATGAKRRMVVLLIALMLLLCCAGKSPSPLRDAAEGVELPGTVARPAPRRALARREETSACP